MACPSNGMPQTTSRIRYAVVGLGEIAQDAVLPAFQQAENSELAAFVSGDPEKDKALGEKYGISQIFSYDGYDELLHSGKIDAVYIALPNHMHAEYAVRAAQAGIHVLCEKPMAVTEDECLQMISAAAEADVKLMIAYRLHFEAANLESIRVAQSGDIGDPRAFHSLFSQSVTRNEDVRLAYPPQQGGGPVYDMGVYCINAARYLFRDEPYEAIAVNPTPKTYSVILNFPKDRVASFTVSFEGAQFDAYTLLGTKGSVQLIPAYGYEEGSKQNVKVGKEEKQREFPKTDHFAPELIYFSNCIMNDEDPEPSGEEGMADVQIVSAIHEAAESGKPQPITISHSAKRPTVEQEISRPAVEEPELVHAFKPGS